MIPIAMAWMYYENIVTIHLLSLGLTATMIMVYRLTGFHEKKPIVTDWLTKSGSNPHSSFYTVEKIFPTGYECVFDQKTKDKINAKPAKSTLFVWLFVHLKSLTMIAVTMAILAVDFPPIFYRTMCKSEEIGISLMDTGVALITLNAGISGLKARPWHEVTSARQCCIDLLRSFQGILLPILFGFLRFCVISDLDYQDHPSEWGIHWNFYTTIAAITLCQNIIVKSKYTMLIGITLLFSY